jgi:hypothetical protein
MNFANSLDSYAKIDLKIIARAHTFGRVDFGEVDR